MNYTKEQLQGVGDKQVNCSLSSLLHDSEIVGNLHEGEFFIAKTKQGVEYFVDDYCNNPSDIMPLAFEHGISIIKDVDAEKYYACANFDDKHNQFANYSHEVYDKNPLRAIACCLILVLQEKQ